MAEPSADVYRSCAVSADAAAVDNARRGHFALATRLRRLARLYRELAELVVERDSVVDPGEASPPSEAK